MKCVPKQWNIYILCQRKGKINPQPQYQRAPVWNIAKQQRLIDSILRGYDIPKIYLRESSTPEYEHEVVDGQQRLRAIWDFVEGKYSLSDDSSDLPAGDLTDMHHYELPSDIQDQFGLFELSVVIVEDADELEIRDLFLRLQEGVTLNPAEKRNAMTGNMRDFIAELAEHCVFQFVRMSENAVKRFGKDDWIAHVVCLENSGNHVDIKAANLMHMYEANQKFNSAGPVAKKVTRVLNYMASVLEPDTPEMNVKWGFVDLYWLISHLIDEYDLKGREKDIQNFYITFEQRRRSIDDIEDLARSSDFLNRSLFNYIQAFQRSGALKRNIEIRHNVYREWVHTIIPNLTPKDPNRNYSENERLVVWRRALESCQKCGAKISFDKMHADHILPHARGGKTTLENAQSLCATCNLKKSANQHYS